MTAGRPGGPGPGGPFLLPTFFPENYHRPMRSTLPIRDEHAVRTSGPLSGPILLLTLSFFVNFTTRTMIGPLLPLLEQDLGLTHTQSGSLFLFNSVGGLVSLVCSGFILARIGYHRTIILSMFGVGIVAALIGFGGGFAVVASIFVLLGLAAGLYIPSAVVIIENIVPPAVLSRAMAIHEMAPNMGLVVAPLAVELMIGGTSWRGALFMGGSVCLVMGLVWAKFGRGGSFRAHPPNRAIIGQAVRQPEMWTLGLLFSLGLTAEVGVYNLLPLFLVTEKGYVLSEANYLVGLTRIPNVAIVLISGFISDRWGWRRTLTTAVTLTGLALLLIGLGPAPLIPYCVLIQAMGAAAFWPPAMALLARSGSSETKAVVVSWAMAISSVFGFGVVPAAIGALADRSLFGWGIAGTGVLVLGGLTLIPILARPRVE